MVRVVAASLLKARGPAATAARRTA
jgi:hypothetical protein